MGMTSYLYQTILVHLLNEGEWVPPESLWLALCDEEFNEASGSGYERQMITLAPPGTGVFTTSNIDPVTFPSLPAFTVANLVIFDVQEFGNSLLFSDSMVPVTVEEGAGLSWEAGDITVSIP